MSRRTPDPQAGSERPPDTESPSAAAGTGGTLYVVATPIGNLGDVTLRALEILGSVPMIACEDTRMTRRLLARHGIEARLASFHARSGPRRLGELVGHLRDGADLALVTDAGTPGVSDPGGDLVAAWAAEGGRVVPIPGPSAVLAAIAATGVAGPRWVFEGFLPRGGHERRRRLAALAADDRGAVIYEAANRLAPTLRDLGAACGGARVAAVCRELTKVHEQIVRGSLEVLATAVEHGDIPARGEVVIVIGHEPRSAARRQPSEASAGIELARTAVEALIEAGTSRRDAVRLVARDAGLPRRELYRRP